MALTRIVALSQLNPGDTMEVRRGDQVYALCNVDGEIHCLSGICPHAGGPLGQGALHGDMLVCPWHAWEFNCRTGANDCDEDLVLKKFPVFVKDGDVFVDIPTNDAVSTKSGRERESLA